MKIKQEVLPLATNTESTKKPINLNIEELFTDSEKQLLGKLRGDEPILLVPKTPEKK